MWIDDICADNLQVAASGDSGMPGPAAACRVKWGSGNEQELAVLAAKELVSERGLKRKAVETCHANHVSLRHRRGCISIGVRNGGS